MGSNSISEILGGDFREVLISFNFVRRSDVEMLVDSGFCRVFRRSFSKMRENLEKRAAMQ